MLPTPACTRCGRPDEETSGFVVLDKHILATDDLANPARKRRTCPECLAETLTREASLAGELVEFRKKAVAGLFSTIADSRAATRTSPYSRPRVRNSNNRSGFSDDEEDDDDEEVENDVTTASFLSPYDETAATLLLEELRARRVEIESLRREESKIAEEEVEVEEAIRHERARLNLTLQACSGIQSHLDGVRAELERLAQSTALNDAFHVWEKDSFGTINSLRLGRSWDIAAVPQVEWSEICAGLGEMALLLSRMAARAEFRFAQFEIIPLGSWSVIRENSTGIVDRLFYSGSPQEESPSGQNAAAAVVVAPPPNGDEVEGELRHLVREGVIIGGSLSPAQRLLLHHSLSRRPALASFNRALVGWTICLQEFARFAVQSKRGAELELSDNLYTVKVEVQAENKYLPASLDAFVNGISVQTDGRMADAKRWTEALRYAMSNLKWLLVWVQ